MLSFVHNIKGNTGYSKMSVGSIIRCDQCSVYIQIEPIESTPLLNSVKTSKDSNEKNKCQSFCGVFKLLSFSALIFGGCGIASYLLMKDNNLIMSDFSLDLVTTDAWRKNISASVGNPLDDRNVMNIIIMQTGGDHCSFPEQCIDNLRTMQKTDNSELPYNFLIGGDGQSYEVRGWDHESGLSFLPQKSTIVIGFLGNFNKKSPTEKQFKNAYSLIEEMRRRQKLNSNFKIFGFQNMTNSLHEAQEIIREISKWKRFSATLKML